MLKIERVNQFKKDYKLARKRGNRLEHLESIVELLASQKSLPARCKPHKLTGDLAGYWECHVEPDYLLVYMYGGDSLILVRLGTHSDLF